MEKDKVVDLKKEESKKEIKTVYRYLFSYHVFAEEKHPLKQPVMSLKPGAIEIEFFETVKTTIPVNQYIKSILEEDYQKNKLANPSIPDVKILQVQVNGLDLLYQEEREVEIKEVM